MKEYFMQSNLLFFREYKIKTAPTDKIIYEDGTCLEKNAKPKNIGSKIQYNWKKGVIGYYHFISSIFL